MPLVRIMLKQVQSLRVGESVMFNEAHHTISQLKHDRMMWFDRVPQMGEFVIFPDLQGDSFAPFQVDQVQHFPSNVNSSPAVNAVPTSLVVLQPILARL